jgi:hypothetical protein
VKIVTSHKSEKEINIMFSIQKKKSGFEITSAFMHGKSKLTVESEFDLQPDDWNINMKVQFIALLIVFTVKDSSIQKLRNTVNYFVCAFKLQHIISGKAL